MQAFSFIPVKNGKIVITIRIEDYRVKEIDKIARTINLSRNELISQRLDFAIKNIDFKEAKSDKSVKKAISNR